MKLLIDIIMIIEAVPYYINNTQTNRKKSQQNLGMVPRNPIYKQ